MTTLFQVKSSGLMEVARSSLASEEALENWISNDPSIIGLDVLVLGRQIITDHSGRIDILAIDREGDLVVVELKRDQTPRDVVAQVLDYASWVAGLSTKRIHEIAVRRLNEPLELAFRNRFDAPLPEALNGNHNMVIVASEFDPSSKRIVEYLAQQHGVAINTAFFSVFECDGRQLLATDWLMDQQEVVDRSDDRKKPPWNGEWYANVGDTSFRSWEDMRRYNFIAAGGGRFYSGKLDQLGIGDAVYAYVKKAGYVGFGRVTSTAMIAKEFDVGDGKLLEQKLVQPNLAHDKDDPKLAEYAVGIEWHRTVSIPDAKTFHGAFANQNIVCKLRDPATLEFLRKEFGVPGTP